MKKGFLPFLLAAFLICLPCLKSFGDEAISYCVYFTDEADENRYIFNPQRGVAEEAQISVTFPEKIIGKDGFFWEALYESPQVFQVSGFGLQKFYIQYQRGEWAGALTGEEEDEQEALKRAELEEWQSRAWEADCVITGQDSAGARDPYLSVSDQTGNDRRITGLLSMIPADNKWRYFYMIGKNYVPDTSVIGSLPKLTYSAVTIKRLLVGEETYHIVKVGVCRSGALPDENTGIPGSWRVGDRMMRKLGNRLYQFTCVDEDYDTGAERQKAALFLCDSVIRADIDSDEQALSVLHFGADNNYRFSEVRSWLMDNDKAEPDNLRPVPTGLRTAFGGSTEAGAFEQMAVHNLRQYDIGFQQLYDSMFCLSVEEAIKYRFHLWKFNGEAKNNPQTQISPYSRGYYLRTPVYEVDENGFCHGQQIYVVDLEQGNIHPSDTDSSAYGIRPAFMLPQD